MNHIGSALDSPCCHILFNNHNVDKKVIRKHFSDLMFCGQNGGLQSDAVLANYRDFETILAIIEWAEFSNLNEPDKSVSQK